MCVLEFLTLFAICFFSGLLVAKNLHPNCDAKAMFLLAPASGLMSIFLLNKIVSTNQHGSARYVEKRNKKQKLDI